jgi:hypothetical protein
MFEHASQIIGVERKRSSDATRFTWASLSAFAVLSLLWSSNAFAECTIAKIRDCTRSDPAAAEKLLRHEIAKNRQPSLLAQLGEFYRDAPQQFQDKAQAIWYLRRASNAGDASAAKSLAEMLLKGEGVITDPQRAIALLEKADSGRSNAAAPLALAEYYRSNGDTEKARATLQQAAELGNAQARKALSALLEDVSGPKLRPTRSTRQSRGRGVASPPPPVAVVVSPPAAATATDASEPDQIVAEASVTTGDLQTVTADPAPGGYDPPSTLAGRQLTIDEVLRAAYAAGFTTEDQLLPAIATAIAESQLFTQARNWQPDKGFRLASDAIGVPGPPEAWSADKRQMHSDRGLWQIGSKAWGYYPDSTTDDPDKAARAVFLLSRGGLDFEIWDSYASGRAQRHYDQAFVGWPALRPLVKRFLSGTTPETVGAIPGRGSG